ncbi:MAG: Cof-type HAD-IIB family hydrolase [Cyanobacteriota bacterium]
MSHSIKLLALDIDGTLMGHDYILRDEVVNTIKKVVHESEIKVVLATGRMTHSTVPIAKQMDITNPLILYQGAMVKDYVNNKILFKKPLPADLAEQIAEELESEDIQVNLYINDILMMKQITEVAISYGSARYVDPVKIKDFSVIRETSPIKIVGLDRNTKKISQLVTKYAKKYEGKLGIVSSIPEFLEVTSCDVNKGITLFKTAKELWNIEPENIMAIGDGNNDYDMIRLAGYGIAMGNATDKIKSVARYITKDVMELGSVEAIEKLIFLGVRL